MTSTQPTLLVFTRDPVSERRCRPLLPQPLADADVALRRACVDAALAAGAGAGCRLTVSSPHRMSSPNRSIVWHRQPAGSAFGARLLAALGACERSADGPVVLVGGDVPDLDPEHVRAAIDLVTTTERDRVALGPSPDGGFYLLAAARPVAHLLRGVRWRRRDTCASVRATLERAGFDVVLLPALADLDRPADLESWLARRPRRDWGPLLRWLRRRLTAWRRALVGAIEPRRRLPAPAWALSRRGPPRRR